MAGLAPQGSQYDARHYDSKIIEVLGAKGQDFFTSYDEVYDSFDAMGLKENLLRGFEKPSPIQQRGILPLCEGFDVIQQAQQGTGKTATFCSGILQQLDYDLVESGAPVVYLICCGDSHFVLITSRCLCWTKQMKCSHEVSRTRCTIFSSCFQQRFRRKVDRLTDKMQSHDHTLSATHGYMIKTEGTLSCRTFALVPLVCSLLLTSWHVVLMSSKSHLLSIMISRHSQRTASIELTVVDGLGGRVLLSTLSPRMMKECFWISRNFIM